MKKYLLILCLLINHYVQACDPTIQPQGALITTNKNIYKVIGDGRAYFYTLPSEECKDKSTFLVKNDQVYITSTLNGFYHVSYLSKRLGLIDGWMKKDRLIQTEFTSRPDYETQESREKAFTRYLCEYGLLDYPHDTNQCESVSYTLEHSFFTANDNANFSVIDIPKAMNISKHHQNVLYVDKIPPAKKLFSLYSDELKTEYNLDGNTFKLLLITNKSKQSWQFDGQHYYLNDILFTNVYQIKNRTIIVDVQQNPTLNDAYLELLRMLTNIDSTNQLVMNFLRDIPKENNKSIKCSTKDCLNINYILQDKNRVNITVNYADDSIDKYHLEQFGTESIITMTLKE